MRRRRSGTTSRTIGSFGTINNPRLAGDYIVFPLNVGGGGRGGRGGQQQAEQPQPAGPVDEWDRYYSLEHRKPGSKPVLLTTTDGLIEDQTSIALSPDGKTFYYSTNAKDIDRRHIWAVPVAGGTPRAGDGGQGDRDMAGAARLREEARDAERRLEASAVGRRLEAGGTARRDARSSTSIPTVARDEELSRPTLHVEPTAVMTKAADGLEVPNQLFLPKDLKPGEKRPAIIFVHGGPVRQMLLGYHYMHFYHWAYGINQWLANKGYVVMSVNYPERHRLRPFVPQRAEHRQPRQRRIPGRLAGGKYLQIAPERRSRTASASGACRTAAC